MSSLKVPALFLGIGALPVVALARTAAAIPWVASASVPEGLIMVLIVAVPFYGIALLVSKSARGREVVAMSAVGWFAFFFVNSAGLRTAIERAGWNTPLRWLVVILALVGLATWIGARFDRDARFLMAFVPSLVLIQGLLFVVDLTKLDEPKPVSPPATQVEIGTPPSIWVILLDSNASPRALRASHRVDLSDDVARLESAGFRVWDDARSNYSHTLVSIPSLLSGQIWDPAVAEANYAQMLAGLRADTPLVAALKNAGLTIRMIPANWSRSSCGEVVDECYGHPLFTEHWYFLLRSTPLPDLFPGPFADPWPSRGGRSLEAISELPPAEAHFTFVHTLATHPPTVMNEDCRPVAARIGQLANQLPCAHDVLWNALKAIDLSKDVVIIAADHGYNIKNALDPAADWKDEVARDRLSAFVAISTPTSCEDRLDEKLSIAQILPSILNCYGAEVPVPDHRFMKVTSQRLGGVEVEELQWDGWSLYNQPATP